MKRGFSGNINIGAQLNNLVRALEKKDPDKVASSKVQLAWKKATSGEVSDHTNGIFIVPNTNCSEVIIYVDSFMWATDLNMQSERFRMYLNLALYEMGEHPKSSQNQQKDSELFSVTPNIEIVKKLKFRVSRENYINPNLTTSTKEQLEQDDEIYHLKPVPIEKEKEEDLKIAAQSIENEKLRAIVLNCAISNLGKQKAMEEFRNKKLESV